ncbi:hypothetical protein [Paraburkholderia caballeronis]|uniref:Extended Signal Peptide of Type V secretion system n=1 Tax=Paraburkholderia caballeronis TaxID=416943 RepID=A0A1H7UMC5_9BURK|nr:hypothetical protein [Paraburkholderia caballeronis]PXW26594.1 hypothetical protein C7403_104475 [Paraburkholderia caballeronis]PXX02140.1 hypothetical protein C7407_104474 [Paraburkholderia caballeronis]RAK01297.1 hypothetical protein C7409_104474 [Paraburkholderia caballeronis]SEB86625.1 hypothetical protein SAMN05445871_1219 [Paraburkholderia caballeronis]SEL98242.1 hypothetical protein SAMN05192542_1207 [Paraburkholderia caballeronis]
MTICLTTPASTGRCPNTRVAALLGVLFGLAAAVAAPLATAQQVVNPGDIIVERDITPRSAFASIPKSEDPVSVRATTFPKNSFDPMMASLVSDTDLTNARGSTGVAPGGILNNNSAGMQAVTRILSGNPTGSNTALGAAGAGVGAVSGIGGTISSTVTGALAPLSTALSGALGGMK